MIELHRYCGACDCRDANRWEPDTSIYNPLFVCGCDKENTVKPPCKYIARFECDVKNDWGEWLAQVDMPLRQLCEFGPIGEYVGLVGDPYTGGITNFHNIEGNAYFQYACSISQRYNLQGGYPSDNAATFTFLRSVTRWKLNIATSPMTFVHSSGVKYAVNSWDCLGPNTLFQVNQSATTGAQQRLPKKICITPEIVTAVPQRGACPNNFFQVTLPAIEAGQTSIPAQRLEFLPVPSALVASGFAAEYFAQIKLYGHVHIGFGGGGQDAICYSGGGVGAGWSGINNPGGLRLVDLRVVSAMDANRSSSATLGIRYIIDCNAGFTAQAVYSCNAFSCVGGIFRLTNNSPGFPEKFEVKSHGLFYSEADDQGLCPYGNCRDVDWEPSRPTYTNETTRKACCDPFCACAPGTIQIFCPSKGTQKFGGCDGITFCTGGRTGITSPSGPSREYCVTAVATDGSSHTICCVVYCSGSTWKSEWYCDGTYVGAGTNGSQSCCPFTFTQDMPTISCLPGCTGCVAINTDPTCHAVTTVSCCQDTLPATMTAAIISPCWGTFNITMTGGGSSWTGSAIAPSGDSIVLLFDIDVNSSYGPCFFTVKCNSNIFNNAPVTATVVSCSPPMLTATYVSSIFDGCSCGFDVSSVITMS